MCFHGFKHLIWFFQKFLCFFRAIYRCCLFLLKQIFILEISFLLTIFICLKNSLVNGYYNLQHTIALLFSSFLYQETRTDNFFEEIFSSPIFLFPLDLFIFEDWLQFFDCFIWCFLSSFNQKETSIFLRIFW